MADQRMNVYPFPHLLVYWENRGIYSTSFHKAVYSLLYLRLVGSKGSCGWIFLPYSCLSSDLTSLYINRHQGRSVPFFHQVMWSCLPVAVDRFCSSVLSCFSSPNQNLGEKENSFLQVLINLKDSEKLFFGITSPDILLKITTANQNKCI